MDLVHESAQQLENLQFLSTDSAPARAEKLAQRGEVARRLCEVVEGREVDAGTCHAAASALMAVQASGAEFIERAQQLAKTAWQRGHPDSGLLYARSTWPAELDLMARLAGLELKQRNGGLAGEAFTAASTAHVRTYGR